MDTDNYAVLSIIRAMRTSDSLEQFFGGYLHQDWRLDDPDGQRVVRRFRSDMSAVEAAEVAKSIRALVAEAPSESELEKHLLAKLGCYYTPRPDLGGPSLGAWLLEVSKALES